MEKVCREHAGNATVSLVLVGDRERNGTAGVVRRAYADGYLDDAELERRLDQALRARTAGELAASVRGVPGGISSVAVDSFVRPAIRGHTTGLRLAAARAIMKIALTVWWATTLVLAAVAIWALAAAIPLAAGVGFLVLWLAASAGTLAVRRRATRLLRS